MAEITVQVRTATGAKRVTVPASSLLSQLKSAITDLTSVPPYQQVIKLGYPPKAIPASSDSDSLSSLGIRHGETLILEQDKSIAAPAVQAPIREEGERQEGPQMIRRVIASDGSCLFNAVGYALEGHRRDVAPELRDVIVGFVLSDPSTYSEALLGKPPEAYCQWISLPSSWGGAIELSILSKYYQVQMACVSIQAEKVEVFGEEEGFSNRVYLLYDNIHYDVLARNSNPSAPEATDATVFSATDVEVLEGALQLAHTLKQQRQYTDLAGCALMCGVCNQGFKGQKEAMHHGKETGHMNFQEVTK